MMPVCDAELAAASAAAASPNAGPLKPRASATPNARAAVVPAALDSRTIFQPWHTLTLYPIVACASGRIRLQLEAEVQVVLRAVLVERPRLILVQRVVLEGRIVEILTIQRDREMIVHGVAQR